MKKFGFIALALVVIALIVVAVVLATRSNRTESVENSGSYETVTFTGRLEAINNSCAADAQCSITVDGKEIITSPGMVTNERIEQLGLTSGFGDLSEIEAFVVKEYGQYGDVVISPENQLIMIPQTPVTVQAYVRVHQNESFMYSIFGSNDYYVRIVNQ